MPDLSTRWEMLLSAMPDDVRFPPEDLPTRSVQALELVHGAKHSDLVSYILLGKV